MNEEDIPALSENAEALQAVYKGLPKDVVEACEAARHDIKQARELYLAALVRAHDALAKTGQWKAWCAAVGVNYNTANTILKRAADGSVNHRKRKQGRKPKPDDKPDDYPREMKLVYAGSKIGTIKQDLRTIGRVTGCANESATVEYLIKFYKEHATEAGHAA
jgi:hypothetical protein